MFGSARRQVSTCGIARTVRSLASALPRAAPVRWRGQEISHVLEDKSGAVWVGSFKIGLTRLDRDGRLLSMFRHGAAPIRSATMMFARFSKTATDACGSAPAMGWTCSIAPAVNSLISAAMTRNADSLRDSFVMSLYQDQAGLRLDRHTRWRREPLESAQLGAWRATSAVGGQWAGHCIRRCCRRPCVDRFAGWRPARSSILRATK